MITANLANNYNKDVFAVPGRVKDTKSEGCNLLIKTHKAGLVETAEDIAYFMRWELSQTHPTAAQGTLFVELDPQEKIILEMIRQEPSPWSIDKISYHAQLPGSEIASVLLNLEFKGLVKSLPGKRFIPV
jgi:DNA processing protein